MLYLKIQFLNILLVLFYFTTSSFSQTILNGNFEINSGGSSQVNISAPSHNSFLPFTNSFGSLPNTDILDATTIWGTPANGNWFLCITGGYTDIVSLQLSSPLLTGNNYQITYSFKRDVGYPTVPFSFNVATTNAALGTTIFNSSASLLTNWQSESFNFIAPNNSQYLVISTPSGSISTWSHIDNIRIIANPLPVELTDFNLKLIENNSVEIIWETETEKNNDFFRIYRSKDSKNWELISTIDGAGNSSDKKTYQYIDENSYISDSYYRLEQVDFDGVLRTQGIKTIRINPESLSVFPNPSSDIITLYCNNSNLSDLTILNSFGQKMEIISIINQKEKDYINIDVSSFQNGIYFIKCKNETLKFIKI